MIKAAWLSDIHLNFLDSQQFEDFIAVLFESRPDVLMISGDIGESENVEYYLSELDKALQIPIYFVLGNHDYYGSSINEVRQSMVKICSSSPNLIWLSNVGVIRLSDDTAIWGHDSWADGGFGDYSRSDVLLNDYFLIKDFKGLSKSERLLLMNSLANEAVNHFRIHLKQAFEFVTNAILITHVPPFREASTYQGKISGDSYLPHFSSKVVGDTLLEIMKTNRDKQLTVLCGHTHGKADVRVLDNLRVLAGKSEYGVPQIQRMFNI